MTDDIKTYRARGDLMVDRVILVTGAGDGIGRVVAKALAAHGATVVLHGRTVSKLEAVYDEISAAGYPRPAICPLDLARASGDDYQKLAETLGAEYGRLDGLLHNAGILGDRAPIGHYDEDVWQLVLHVNLTAVFVLTKACLPLLRKAPNASVVFTSSGVAFEGKAYWGAYSVSKFGCQALMQILAAETEENTSMRFNSLNPGPTRTSMRARAYPAEDPSTLVTPEDIVGAYLYLLGPDSQSVTGQSFHFQ